VNEADASAEPARADRARWAVLAGLTAALLAWLLLRPGGDRLAVCAGITGNLLGPLIGIVWWGRATLHARRDMPRAEWTRQNVSCLLLGLSIVSFFLGQAIFYFYERVLGLSPFPSPADVFFLAAYPLQMAAVLLLPAGGKRRSRLAAARLVLDTLITVGTVATFSWFFLLGPALDQASVSGLARALLAAYPVMDLAILFCLMLLVSDGGKGRLPAGVLALALGLLTLVVADSVFAYQNLHGTYVTGSPNDITWPLGYMLLGLGAAQLRRRASPARAVSPDVNAREHLAPPQPPPRLWQALLPYALLPGLAALVAHVHSIKPETARIDGVELGGTIVVLLILLRQMLALAENARLNRQLRGALAERDAGHRSLAHTIDTLRHSEQRFRLACQSAGDLVYEWTIDERSLEWFGDIDGQLGYGPGEFPRTIDAWTLAVHPDDRARVWAQLDRHLEGHEPFASEYRVVTKDGRVRTWVERGTVVHDEDGRPVRMIGAVGDVTARKLAEQQLRHESLHDALTGLPNRVLFCDRVEQCIRRARRAGPNYHFAVLFLDLDRFKVINDSLGHAAGDRLLIEVGRRLQACLREYDAVSRDVAEPSATDTRTPDDTTGTADDDGNGAVARLGGDEFTILLDGLATADDAVRVAERIQADLSRPIDFEGHELVTSASIGLVHGDTGGQYRAAKDLLRDADAAMYRAKQLGRSRTAVFDASIHAEAVERLRMESDLRRALDRGQIGIQYQPIVRLDSGALIGFEALARWTRDGRPVSPGDFIPVAEDTGMIVPIGKWMLREACRQLAQWRRRHPHHTRALSVAVNLTRKQLADPTLVEDCRRALAEHALDASLLELEITESVIMLDRAAATEALASLKQLGVRLVIDDFGTGYSSLSCLNEFPLDGLKIDRDFTFTPDNRDNAAIVNAIIHLAHHLRMRVVAEGIESAEQLVLLQALDCEAGQGHLFAPPLDAAAAERFITANPPGASVGRRLSA
jgi:PAS domain S-box-containing protein